MNIKSVTSRELKKIKKVKKGFMINFINHYDNGDTGEEIKIISEAPMESFDNALRALSKDALRLAPYLNVNEADIEMTGVRKARIKGGEAIMLLFNITFCTNPTDIALDRKYKVKPEQTCLVPLDNDSEDQSEEDYCYNRSGGQHRLSLFESQAFAYLDGSRSQQKLDLNMNESDIDLSDEDIDEALEEDEIIV